MNLVPRRTRLSHTIFQKLRNGAVYWISTTSGPFVKLGSRLRVTANAIPQTDTGTAVLNDLAVIEEDKFFNREQS
jgi:hypothetical protein